MAVLQMQKISICALKKDRKAVLEKLQRMKVMEISQILEEDPETGANGIRKERFTFRSGTGNSGSVCAGEEVDVFCTGRESADRSR